MSTLDDLAAIHHRFKTVGSALMRVNLNNSHSGNMSCRDPRDSGRFWITASGSACGDLSAEDLVTVHFDDMHYEGPTRPSSETNTHRRVLELPGVNACVHCHAPVSTLLGFDTPSQPAFLSETVLPGAYPKEYLFQPVDVWGAALLGPVPLGVFRKTVGSSEMERRIPGCLRRSPVTIVKGHGPFARGLSLEQCLHHLSVLEYSATVAVALRRRGIELRPLQQAILSDDTRAALPWTPRRPDESVPSSEPCRDVRLRREFDDWLSYHFDLGLGAFGTGSMSRRVSDDEMIFCPMSAAPRGIEVPLYRVALHPRDDDAADVRVHRRVYAATPHRACILAASPLATAEATAALAAAAGIAAPAGGPAHFDRPMAERPVIAPIDAEAAHYGVCLPVAPAGTLAADAGADLVPGLLRTGGGCCLVAGCGALAAGEDHLGQAAYRVSLAERIARFRLEVDLNHRLFGGPPVTAFE